MTATRTRTNDEWVEDLREPGPRREAALDDLRQVLANGLRRGLVGQVDTAAPEFALHYLGQQDRPESGPDRTAPQALAR